MAKKLKKRADGRLQRKITLGKDFNTGKTITKTVYGYTMQEVDKKAADLRAQYEYIDYNDLTVEQYVRAYIEQRKKELIGDNGLNTIESYELMFDAHIVPIIGRCKLVDISTPILRDLINNVKTKNKNCTGQRTRQYVYACLNLLFNRAFKDCLISHNPMLAIDKPKHRPIEKGVVTIKQFEQLMQSIKLEDEQIARILEICLDSGMRRGEIIALRYYDIDLVKGIINVSRSIKRTKKGLIENDPKTTNSKRAILLSKYAVTILAEQKHYSKSKASLAVKRWSDSLHVFTDDNLESIKPDRVTRIFTKHRKALGLSDNISLHSLRHTCATMLSEADISPKKIQLRLGHASAAFTLDRYNHNTEAMQKTVADTLNKLRNANSK